jgi:predicted AAA+ superfamily ATPase
LCQHDPALCAFVNFEDPRLSRVLSFETLELLVQRFRLSVRPGGEVRARRPEADLEEYLYYGGFPETLPLSDGDRLLRQYFHDIVERDVRERSKARSSRSIRQVAQIAFESAGSEMSPRRAISRSARTHTCCSVVRRQESSAVSHRRPRRVRGSEELQAYGTSRKAAATGQRSR